MKPVLRYQSQLLFRKSYKPERLVRIRLAQRAVKVFRPGVPVGRAVGVPRVAEAD